MWEVRHACFLALKYFVVAGREASGGPPAEWAAEMAPVLMPLLCAGLEDPHDDVRAAAAFALKLVAADFAAADPAAALRVLAGLMRELDASGPDELSRATVTALALVPALLRAPPLLDRLLGDDAKGAFVPFVRHRQAAVRSASLHAICDVAGIVVAADAAMAGSPKRGGGWSAAVASHALGQLFCATMTEGGLGAREAAVEAWVATSDALRFP
jgi:HEAT repeat protein